MFNAHSCLKRKPQQPAPTSWNVPALCAAYQWPTGLAGGGVIAIVELGGGWMASDMSSFFAGLNQPVPSITDVSVDGTKNTPGQDADAEVALDIQVAGAAYFAATGKAATIRVYWAQDIASAVAKAQTDGCDVCSISWGADESEWPAGSGVGSINAMDIAAETAASAGMVVFAASGDNDSSDGVAGAAANVDAPASCQHVIGCGGTTKTASAESVWNDNPGETDGSGTGGGCSTVFGQSSPIYSGVPGRMVPDASANADPETGYNIFLHGSTAIVGGTSAVAPLYAGLFAAFGKKLGDIRLRIYNNPYAFNDITIGENGSYNAMSGPDPCTGLGSPIGTALAKLFVGA